MAGKVEIESLARILSPGESLKGILTGSYHDMEGVIVATNQRLLHLRASSWTQFPYTTITSIKNSSIEFEDGKKLETIILISSGGKTELRHIPNDTTAFVKLVRSIMPHHAPLVQLGTETTGPVTKSRKKYALAISLLFIILAGYFIINHFSQNTAASLGCTPSQFQDRWNQAGNGLHSPFKMNEIDLVTDGEDQSFTYYLTPELKMIGIILKDGTIRKIMILGRPNDQLSQIIEQAISVADPKLTKKDRDQLLANLGTQNSKRHDVQISQNNISYSMTFPEKVGVVFEASATGK